MLEQCTLLTAQTLILSTSSKQKTSGAGFICPCRAGGERFSFHEKNEKTQKHHSRFRAQLRCNDHDIEPDCADTAVLVDRLYCETVIFGVHLYHYSTEDPVGILGEPVHGTDSGVCERGHGHHYGMGAGSL